jgi:hypothetical protein
MELKSKNISFIFKFRVTVFLHNKDIDHLYSFQSNGSYVTGASSFAPDSIRMKSNLGLAGKAFSSGKI